MAVQFFGLSKAFFRYSQRLVGHDAALRALSDLRVRVYRRLEPLAPAGLPAFRSGDLIARFVHDVDSVQDLVVRVIAPLLIAIFVGVATVALVWAILPAAGLILLIALALSATVVPWLTGTLARRSEARHASVRGELTAAVVDLVHGAPELIAYGSAQRELERAQAIDERLGRIARDSGRTAGIGQGLATALPGLAMVGALLVGVAAVRGGRLDVVLLAVIAVVPLAAFELVSGLPAATQTLQRVRPSLWRTRQVLRADPLVVGTGRTCAASVTAVYARGARAGLPLRRRRAMGAARTGPRSDAGPPSCARRPQRRRKVDARARAAAPGSLPAGIGEAQRRRDRRISTGMSAGA